MASSYYDSTGKDVTDGNTATQSDVNNINAAVDTGFQGVETDLNDATTGVVANKGYAEEWATAAEDTLVSVAAGGDGVSDYSALHWAAKAAADVVLTNADVVSTNADVVLTNADVVSTNADVVLTGLDVTAAEAAQAAAEAAAATLPSPAAGRQGAIIVQNTDDATFDLIASNGTSGHPLVSAGADSLPAYSQLTAAGVAAGEGILNSDISYVKVSDVKSATVDGGGFTAGSWVTRTLNTKDSDTGNIATLAANQITLPAGTYGCRIVAPAFSVNYHQIRLYNITTTAVVLTGKHGYSADTVAYAQTESEAVGRFVLGGATVLEVQHRCSVTRAVNGLGVQNSFGTGVFTVAEFWKVA